MNNKEKSIIQMAKGAIEERIDYEMTKIVQNIRDESTKATGARELTIKIKLVPDDNREVVQVSAAASSKLQPTTPIVTSLYMGKDLDGTIGAVEMTPQIPGQYYADGTEEEAPAKLRMIKITA